MSMKRQQFDHHLNELRSVLVEMGERVERATEDSVRSLVEADPELARQVIDRDPEMNLLEERIDQIGTSLIVTQQPVAKDLRRIMIAFRMASDLERMADLAVDIAKVTIRLGGQGRIKPLVDIPRMSNLVCQMTRDSIQAYVEENVDLAYRMAQMDDEVDQLHSQVLRDLFALMIKDPDTANQAMLLSFVSRYLERIADHATNLGENVVYLAEGRRPDLNK